MKDEHTPVYMISVVAQLVGVHPQTLRFYENEGLIKPSRTGGRTRLYSEADLRKVRKIISLTRDRSINIAGVEMILQMEEELSRLFEILSSVLDETGSALLLKELEEEEFETLDIEKLLKLLS